MAGSQASQGSPKLDSGAGPVSPARGRRRKLIGLGPWIECQMGPSESWRPGSGVDADADDGRGLRRGVAMASRWLGAGYGCGAGVLRSGLTRADEVRDFRWESPYMAQAGGTCENGARGSGITC